MYRCDSSTFIAPGNYTVTSTIAYLFQNLKSIVELYRALSEYCTIILSQAFAWNSENSLVK